MTYGNNWNSV